eukprot:TRINITY_DN1873_c0_g1_i6.p1 TRINITY_DN1873_c0_g1~~TRINITY_DN1873_c0_g1_i6.p1  ORF type:complete len:404 (+),score=-58.75 TRINITY_DN1873_c0_g1_i6:381-1592(+)
MKQESKVGSVNVQEGGIIKTEAAPQDPMVEFPGLAAFYQKLQKVRVLLPHRGESWTGYLSKNARTAIRELGGIFDHWKKNYRAEYDVLKEQPTNVDKIQRIEEELRIFHNCIFESATYFAACDSQRFFTLLRLTQALLSWRYGVDFSAPAPGKDLFSQENLSSLTVEALKAKVEDVSYVICEDEAGNLPISFALLRGYSAEIIEVLLTRLPMWQLQHIDCSGRGVFDQAVYYGRASVAELILKKMPGKTLPFCGIGLRLLLQRPQSEAIGTAGYFHESIPEKVRERVFRLLREVQTERIPEDEKKNAQLLAAWRQKMISERDPGTVSKNSSLLWNRKEREQEEKQGSEEVIEKQGREPGKESSFEKQSVASTVKHFFSFLGGCAKSKQETPASGQAEKYEKLK